MNYSFSRHYKHRSPINTRILTLMLLASSTHSFLRRFAEDYGVLLPETNFFAPSNFQHIYITSAVLRWYSEI
ncbi:uncharacterized protein EI90DRAFT_3079318, partial [Cantharellus anzutake]|uniref:uncharacterized protein n=1 Tax=Cantharellus anzutake TaxID=1750568 RepID=UPI001907521A